MKTVNIHEAKTHLSRLVEEAAAGEEVVIAKAGKPLVRLVPVAAAAGPRKLGMLAGQVTEADDCWEPDPETVQRCGRPRRQFRFPTPIPPREPMPRR